MVTDQPGREFNNLSMSDGRTDTAAHGQTPWAVSAEGEGEVINSWAALN